MPDFKSEIERREWIINNASHFTVVRRRNRQYDKVEVPTLEEAKRTAAAWVAEIPDKVCLIYAVSGIYDTWVMNVRGK